MCNRIWGSHDATLFPLDMDENDEFFLYRRTFCRRLPVKFNRTTRYNGLDAYEFVMEPDSFDSDVDNTNSWITSERDSRVDNRQESSTRPIKTY